MVFLPGDRIEGIPGLNTTPLQLLALNFIVMMLLGLSVLGKDNQIDGQKYYMKKKVRPTDTSKKMKQSKDPDL